MSVCHKRQTARSLRRGYCYDGYYFYRSNNFFWAHFLGLYCFVFKGIRGVSMLAIYWIGGITSFVLFVYLLIALLKPEIF